MVAFVVVVLAVLSRLLPHLLGVSAWGVTAMGGGLLFFGSGLPAHSRWKALLVVPVIAATDWYLSTVVYGFPFHASSYLVPWMWYAGVACLGSLMLHRRRTVVRVGLAAVGSATGFFVLSNGLVWLSGTMYPKTASGLVACYAAGLPFYRNDAIATVAVCGVLFGAPLVAGRLSEAAARAGDRGAAA